MLAAVGSGCISTREKPPGTAGLKAIVIWLLNSCKGILAGDLQQLAPLQSGFVSSAGGVLSIFVSLFPWLGCLKGVSMLCWPVTTLGRWGVDGSYTGCQPHNGSHMAWDAWDHWGEKETGMRWSQSIWDRKSEERNLSRKCFKPGNCLVICSRIPCDCTLGLLQGTFSFSVFDSPLIIWCIEHWFINSHVLHFHQNWDEMGAEKMGFDLPWSWSHQGTHTVPAKAGRNTHRVSGTADLEWSLCCVL